jgi:hypothetical protein
MFLDKGIRLFHLFLKEVEFSQLIEFGIDDDFRYPYVHFSFHGQLLLVWAKK